VTVRCFSVLQEAEQWLRLEVHHTSKLPSLPKDRGVSRRRLVLYFNWHPVRLDELMAESLIVLSAEHMATSTYCGEFGGNGMLAGWRR
jgi:hypothetical protein